MSGYIGPAPVPQATQTRETFTATSGQTSFATAGYTVGFLDVYLNGVHLVDGDDYTASNGSDVVLSSGATAGDILEVVAYKPFEVVDQNFTGDFSVDTDTLYVDSANNRVGVGTSSPGSYTTTNLVAAAAGTNYLTSVNTITGLESQFGSTGDGTVIINRSAEPMRFFTNSSEAMRIDSSGNLLVGTTGVNPHNPSQDAGAALRSDGRVLVGVDGDIAAAFNRNISDGDIISFRKNATTVGSIGSVDSNSIAIGTGDTRLRFSAVDNSIRPGGATGASRDNAIDLGTASVRFDDIYATNGTIQTSDRNEKQDIEALSEAEQRVAVACKGLMRKFRWKSAVEEKGDDARIHFGIIAQDLQDAFAAEGLDAGRYGMFISSTWWEAEETYTDDDGVEQTRTNTYDTQEEAPEGAIERTRMGVRYPELLAFIIAAI